ncbi:MAG: hypothetical protein EZS28_023878, partial [Streblomastix strix]
MKSLEIIAQQPHYHLPSYTLRALMLQILEGMDIKLENILLHSPNDSGRVHAKISDFGFAKVLGYLIPKGRDVTNDPTQLKGSRPYMAPELYKGQIQLTQKIDVYALGVTFYVMITHKFPLNQPTFQEQKIKLAQIKGFNRPSEIKDDLLWDLLQKMLEFDPEKRITIDEAMHHPYFTGPQAISEFSPEQMKLVQQAKQAKENGDESITEYDMDPYFTVAESEIKKFILEDIRLKQPQFTQSSSSEVIASTQSSSSEVYTSTQSSSSEVIASTQSSSSEIIAGTQSSSSEILPSTQSSSSEVHPSTQPTSS